MAISQVEGPLPRGESFVPFARLDVDHVRHQLAGVAAEQDVRQRAVAPEEPGQVEPHEQADERVEQPVAEVRDREALAGEQVAVRQRVVEVAGDEQAVALVARGR